MAAYYNEIDPFAAAWLRELIRQGHIADGVVDERSIVDVEFRELDGFVQCHFFAGIGVWSHALRLAGWPDDRPVWTGSCPCQPFSSAGKGKGQKDERHLWPVFRSLVEARRPPVVFGEQVASAEVVGSGDEAAFALAVREGRFAIANRLAKKLARSKTFHFHQRWLDLVQSDLVGAGYAFGTEVFPAAGVGAPHVRQRLYWVGQRVGMADAGRDGLVFHAQRHGESSTGGETGEFRTDDDGCGGLCGMADADGNGRSAGRGSAASGLHGPKLTTAIDHASSRMADPARPRHEGDLAVAGVRGGIDGTERSRGAGEGAGSPGSERVADANNDGRSGSNGYQALSRRDKSEVGVPDGRYLASEGLGRSGPTNGHWRDADWLRCRDGKWRPVEPGTFPLADGSPARVGRLRGYGNAIVAQQAAAFVEAVMETMERS